MTIEMIKGPEHLPQGLIREKERLVIHHLRINLLENLHLFTARNKRLEKAQLTLGRRKRAGSKRLECLPQSLKSHTNPLTHLPVCRLNLWTAPLIEGNSTQRQFKSANFLKNRKRCKSESDGVIYYIKFIYNNIDEQM